MSLFDKINPDRLNASRLWTSLDRETRTAAAAAAYRSKDRGNRLEADAAIAEQMRFRLASVKKLPAEKRIGYVAGSVRPDESLAATLLLAYHLEYRRDILSAFLDSLGVPNDEGIIDEDHEMTAPGADELSKASEALFDSFPGEQVELYLASLLALDNITWGGLAEVIRNHGGN